MIRRLSVCAGLALCVLVPALSVPAADPPVSSEPVRIGMVGTLFNDVPQGLIDFASIPFRSLMKEFTGLDGQIKVGGDGYDVGKKLANKELDLAVFHSFEFGWAQQKYPELRPLTVAVSKQKMVRGFLVVKADSNLKGLSDLKGKDLGFPRKTKELCRVYIDRMCNDCGQCVAKSFFGQVVHSNNVDDALDDILRGKLQCVVTDSLSYEEYADIKPGCHARLKVLKQSEPFPPAVIAYREGTLSEDVLKRFRDGMISANQSPRGRDMMSIFKMTAFEPVPDNYTQMIADIIRLYPAPAAADKVSQK